MSGPVLGIDLGTTNSVVAVADAGGARVLPDAEGYALVPSVVSFHPNGEILVGRAARERRLLDARNTIYSIKRLIGRPFRSPEVSRAQERFPFELREGPTGGVLVAARGDTYSLSEISAFVLRQVRAVAEQALEETCTRAIVTVPANFNELQRSATKAAGRVAGLDVLRILNEPTAAALAYGYGRGSREKVAIFDLGGGTFDITILELSGEVFEVLATAGDTYLGGDDIDVLVADQMADAFLEHHQYDPRQDQQAYERLRAAAEWAKCQLSFQDEVQLRVEELAYGDGGISLDLGFGLTRGTLEQMVMPLITRAFDVCEDAMRIAGMRPTTLDNVILVGGSTRMPLVQRMVAEYFGREPLSNIDPDLVVAKGAAIQGAALIPAEERRLVGRMRLKRVTQAELEAVRPEPPLPLPEVPAVAASSFAYDDDSPTVVRRSERAAIPMDSETTRVAPSDYPAAAPPPFEDDETDARRSAASYDDVTEPELFREAPRPVPPPPPAHAVRPLGGRTLQGVAAVPPPPPLAQPAFAPDRVPDPRDVYPVEVDVGPLAAPEPTGGVSTGRNVWRSSEYPSALAEPAPGQPAAVEPPAMAPPPLLLDVTPQTLGVETVGGYCEPIIKRNAAIPVEQTKIFTTAQDHQEVVRVRICQGESRRLVDNQGLGEIVLTGLRIAPRGGVQIGVTFMISSDGTLGVRARDLVTGQEQTIRINLVGGTSDTEIERMRARQAALLRPGSGG